ncbi:MAG TPA: stage II sporulation protein M [Nitrososphaerales archaeon]|nr:stage II sporulation protein M [Nitrososphaerales archaeon]
MSEQGSAPPDSGTPQAPPESPQKVPAPPPRVLDELLGRDRAILILVVLLVELAIFVVGLVTPLGSAEQQSIANQTSSQFQFVSTATPVELVGFIFFHNLAIALIEMVPVFGAVFFLISIYTTGLATQAIVGAQGLPGTSGLILFALPYSIVELSAYAIAVGAGTMLLLSLFRKKFTSELKVFAVEGAVVGVVLVSAATMETITRYSVLAGLALWVPTLFILAALVILATRRKKPWSSI